MCPPCCKFGLPLVLLGLLTSPGASAAAGNAGDVSARLVLPAIGGKQHGKAALSAAIWLTPLHGDPRAAVPSAGTYTLLQKDKQFSPHLLVVPVGSTVHFPNQDPFFHNVFSLFDGRRFDLGLYEAGTTRDVTFPREGVSYIFCNIHPEMSAVIVSLATSYYAVADQSSRFHMQDVPPGPYLLHVWVEGENEAALGRLTRLVQVVPGQTDLGAITLTKQPAANGAHANKFGQPYESDRAPAY
jgi:plastocyanin